jgi:protein-S-isoprenylcysteine O-methyltransferase Ste14
MVTASDQPQQPEPIDRRRLITSTISSLLILVLCLFLPAGTWAWFRGWLFLVVLVAASVVITTYLRRVNPEVIAARVNRHAGTKGWDRWLVGFLNSAMVSVLVVAALDDGRFHWSHAPWWVCGIGYFLLIAGLAGMTWAESVNKFFEPFVRIQTDRGHRVIDAGPYAILQHPGYAFGFLFFLGIPLALGWFCLGVDPPHSPGSAPGPENGVGGPNPAGRIAWLRGVRPAGPVPAGPRGLVAT